jgi:tetratricopeptide (TPR) repeat protein
LKALEIFKINFGEEHEMYVNTLSNLSVTLKKLGDYNGAKKGFLKALKIFNKNFGEVNAQIDSTLANLSNTL